MKKMLGLLVSLLIVFGVVGNASAILYTDIEALNQTLGEGPITSEIWSDSYSYTHDTPTDFEVPWDIVNSATLSITASWVDGNDDTVDVEGTIVGTLTAGGGGLFNWQTNSTFDITPTFATSWVNGDLLDVTISAEGSCLDGWLLLETSTFTLDYENGTNPVPVPSAFFLLASGILGLAGVSRKKTA